MTPPPTSLRRARRLLSAGLLGAVLVTAGALTAPVHAAAPSGGSVRPATATAVPDGSYVPVAPTRVVDTRKGLGTPQARLGAKQTISPTLAGTAPLPAASAISAVVVNLTVVGATAGTFVTLYPAGTARPGTSSTNVGSGSPVATSATVKLSSGGALSVYNDSGSVDVVLDVVGYYAATTPTGTYGGLTTLTPYRKLDSRTAQPGQCQGPFYDGDGCWLSFDYKDDQGNSDPINDQITAYVVNLTAVGATSDGYLVAWDGNDVTSVPSVSNVNFKAGTTVANLAVVKRGTNDDSTSQWYGKPWIYVEAHLYGGNVQVLVDVVGVMTNRGVAGADDARFVPLASPVRVVDTRVQGLGGTTPFGAATTRSYTGAPVVDDTTSALAGSITLVGPSRPTYVAAFPWGGAVPGVSAVNGNTGAIVTNGALVALAYPPRPTSNPNTFSLYNSAGTTHVLLDVSGTFEVAASTTGSTPGSDSGAGKTARAAAPVDVAVAASMHHAG